MYSHRVVTDVVTSAFFGGFFSVLRKIKKPTVSAIIWLNSRLLAEKEGFEPSRRFPDLRP